MEDVHRLHRPKQGLPEGQVPPTEDRLAGGFHSGHKLLTFMDAFSGYNQVKMVEEDQEKTAFIVSQ